MAEAADNPPPAEESHDEMRWGIHYLRQDLQEHRASTARAFARIEDRLDRHDGKFDELHRIIREQGDRLTQRMMMLFGLSTTIILAAIKL
ncbi:MAG: hypothetical protein HN712_28960 [Gemmatimonadetes bacterium]|jgi:hypothetical protein|nr:hypothetical protein [Gemmatimonadota bacterium]MBT6146402.1 hypothetical protein [Gemmatimonadota bacterium]MBT7864374.1 hypothetical protein [Gemmatimonadota bacterium]